jgi:hypothetical protein
MSRRITRPQGIAIHKAELFEDSGSPSADTLAGRYVISARTNTMAVLVRLGLAEEIVIKSAGEDYTFHALTRAGELTRATLDLSNLPTLEHISGTVEYAAEEAQEQAGERPNDGTYHPAAPGARTWREAHDLWIDGKHVTAGVEGNGTRLYVFLGTEMIYSGDMPADIKTAADVNPWAARYALNYTTTPAAPVTPQEPATDELTEWERDLLASVPEITTTPRYTTADENASQELPAHWI